MLTSHNLYARILARVRPFNSRRCLALASATDGSRKKPRLYVDGPADQPLEEASGPSHASLVASPDPIQGRLAGSLY